MSGSEISVIIPTWNQRTLLERCLASLDQQTVPCSVIVVDNGSKDDTVSAVKRRFPNATCLALDRNYGFAKAVNIGIETAETQYIALLNNDTITDSGWIEAGMKALKERPDYSVFASRMISLRDRSLLDSAGDCYSRTGLAYKRGFGQPVDQYLDPEPVLGASAGAAFYRRELFSRIGMLDETYYMYLEDMDFCLRAQLHGFKCLYIPDAVVYHLEGASDPEHPEDSGASPKEGLYSRDRVFWITRNRWQLMATYQPLRNLPWLVYGWLRSFGFHLLKAGYTPAFFQGLWAGLVLTAQCYRKRKQLGKETVITTSELCSLMKKC